MNKWLFIFLAFLVLFFSISAATATVINNNTQKTFNTIQKAIDDPTTIDGHSIIVTGTYTENIQIEKNITLKANGTATIKAKNTNQPTISITANGAIITGFTITNGYNGIQVQANKCKITNNKIKNNTNNGIYLSWGSSNNTISNNTITNNNYGIYLSGSGNVLRGNIINNCTHGFFC